MVGLSTICRANDRTIAHPCSRFLLPVQEGFLRSLDQLICLSLLGLSVLLQRQPSKKVCIAHANLRGCFKTVFRRHNSAPRKFIEVSTLSIFSIGRRRSRDTSYPAPPAQIPACGFPAPGSSAILTLVEGTSSPWIFPLIRLSPLIGPYMSRSGFL